MALHLYHIPGFRSTRALWLFLELEQALRKSPGSVNLPKLYVHEFKDVAAFRQSKPEWYLEYNPNGKVPTLIDEAKDVVVWESCAVCSYLLDEYDIDGILLAKDSSTKAMYNQLAFYASGTLDNLTSTSSPVQRAVNEITQGKPNMNPVIKPENKHAWKEYCAPYFEELLRKRDEPYILGQNFSAIDVILGLDMFAVHDKMINRGDGISWLDKEAQPLLWEYRDRVLNRDMASVAFSPTKEWSQRLPKDFNVECVPARPLLTKVHPSEGD